MSDFLESLLASDGPVAKEISYGGKTGTVYFRRISAGERAQLLKGQRINTSGGKNASFEIDLADNQHSKHLMVQFSVCKADGSRWFKSLDDVRKADALKVEVLYAAASQVNEEEQDAGKA